MIPRSDSSVGLRVRVQIAAPNSWAGPDDFNGLVGTVEKFTYANDLGTVRELPFLVHFEPHTRPARHGSVEPLKAHWFGSEDLVEVGACDGEQAELFPC